MAPRTRSNRAEKLAVQKLLSSGISVNTRGLPALPNEIYLEILSHMPALPIPHDIWVDKKKDPLRQLTLYYLTQTCQSLRKFFLKFAWERIEVFAGMWTPMGRLYTTAERKKRGMEMKQVGDKRLVEEILRQLEIVIVRNPDLRQYVSIVNLTILKYSHESVLPEIAQNLTLFPNLHTLQLIYQFHHYGQHLPVFYAFRYPNVQTLNLNNVAPHRDILKACPNTRNFSFYKDRSEEYRIEALFGGECASGVEKIGVVKGMPHIVADIVKLFPRLGDISFDGQDLTDSESLNVLSKLPLHTIRVRLDDWWLRPFRCAPAIPDKCKRWIDLAKRVLTNCPEHNVGKRVIVVNYDKTVDEYRIWN